MVWYDPSVFLTDVTLNAAQITSKKVYYK